MRPRPSAARSPCLGPGEGLPCGLLNPGGVPDAGLSAPGLEMGAGSRAPSAHSLTSGSLCPGGRATSVLHTGRKQGPGRLLCLLCGPQGKVWRVSNLVGAQRPTGHRTCWLADRSAGPSRRAPHGLLPGTPQGLCGSPGVSGVPREGTRFQRLPLAQFGPLIPVVLFSCSFDFEEEVRALQPAR